MRPPHETNDARSAKLSMSVTRLKRWRFAGEWIHAEGRMSYFPARSLTCRGRLHMFAAFSKPP